ncbi:hypothetical protein BWZ20_01985 [Winogradskyella sp. J14-2]|uniref:hypothetical protein n=1 Tax=Winogradskyella sp. J14-2 TaxID=1936080 RepID=UPI000972BF8A|nr:hypothetical protein [Winogradskyella sp. J14-2]APY07146.1 hypothetical protein BWZ20_01985 [Winogradskyella sp. J14-2]
MKKFLKHIFYGLLFFVLINVLIVLKYELPAYEAIENKTHKNFLKWDGIHGNSNTYDLIILGSSRAYTSLNPKIIDMGLNLKSFNMGTSSQDITETYYTLKEILDYQNPKYVILETYLGSCDDFVNYYQVFSNASFFKSSEHKYDLVVNGYGSKGIVNYIIPLMKFNNYIKQDITSIVSKRKNKAPKINWYKGFHSDTTVISKTDINKFEPIPNFKNTNFNKDRFKSYFNKIYELTKAHGIQLIVLRTPYPPSRLLLDSNTDENSYYQKFFSNYKDVGYYDLNSYKSDTFNFKDEDFSDFHHANQHGAAKISQQLVDIIKTQQLN